MTSSNDTIYPINILWADDQLTAVKGMSSILSPEFAHVEFAADGAEALEKIKMKNFDFVLTDLAMPPDRWGGLWLLEQLNELENTTPVIVVSGEGTQLETIKAIRLGAVDYITKEKLSSELNLQIEAIVAANSRLKRKLQLKMSHGESESQEFKSTLRINLHTTAKDTNMELAVLKSIAGFLNSKGGNLLIGVDDSGEVVGIELDQFKNTDKFQLHFRNLIRDSLMGEVTDFLRTDICHFNNGTVFSVECSPSSEPVFVNFKSQEYFFVRTGPQTEQLLISKAIPYIIKHFYGGITR